MNTRFSLAAFAVVSILATASAAQAQELPQITPSLKKLLGGLPIAGMKDDVQKMVGALKKTSCGSGLTGCYATKSGPLQLYFFTSGNAQQTFLLVVNKSMALPPLLKPNVQKVLGTISVSDPIISISTADYVLDVTKMPADLQKVVRASYFNVASLTFSSGVQLAARATLSGAIMATMKSLGVATDQMTMRAAVVMPIPTDLSSGAGTGAGLADALRHGDTMKKAGADALKIDAFVEFQPSPGTVLHMIVPAMTLTDSTFFIDNKLVFGYKGNARINGTSKSALLHFQTPLTPEGAMDLLDFSFRMAMPPTFTLTDAAYTAMGMAMPGASLASSPQAAALSKMGGGYIGNIGAIMQPLKQMLKPLSVFQLVNPNPAPLYKFGDPAHPFPTTDAPFNMVLLGPLADGGPLLHTASNVRILGQTMGKMDVSVGKDGFQGTAEETVNLKLGPLGNTAIRLLATTDISASKQDVSLLGNLAGQKMSLVLASNDLAVSLSASCINPFEIKTTVAIKESLNIADIFQGQAGVNVDPSTLERCIGKDLEAALNKIAGEYSTLSGYSAKQATAALNKIASDAQKAADAAAAQTKAVADAAYNTTKNAARNLANKSTSGASKAFNDAGNSISHAFGGKKHHSDGNDRFDRSVFDWDYYYDTRGTAWGDTDLVQDWNEHGYPADKRASLEFDMAYFKTKHPGSDSRNLLNYWLGTGIDNCDQSSAEFSLAALQSRNPGRTCRETYDWYYDQGGSKSGLDGTPIDVKKVKVPHKFK